MGGDGRVASVVGGHRLVHVQEAAGVVVCWGKRRMAVDGVYAGGAVVMAMATISHRWGGANGDLADERVAAG